MFPRRSPDQRGMTWRWRWNTVWEAASPAELIRFRPSGRRTAVRACPTRRTACISCGPGAPGDHRSCTCSFGITSVCPSATGCSGKKARASGDSPTMRAGRSPRTTPQNSHAGSVMSPPWIRLRIFASNHLCPRCHPREYARPEQAMRPPRQRKNRLYADDWLEVSRAHWGSQATAGRRWRMTAAGRIRAPSRQGHQRAAELQHPGEAHLVAEGVADRYSTKVPQQVRIWRDADTRPGTVSCGDGRQCTCCLLFATRGSGVRVPLAPLGGLHVSVGTMFTFRSDILAALGPGSS